MYIYVHIQHTIFKTTCITTIFEQVLSTIYIFAFIKCLLHVLIHAWHRVSLIELVPGTTFFPAFRLSDCWKRGYNLREVEYINVLLLMEEILHHPTCVNNWDIYHINWWTPDFWTINSTMNIKCSSSTMVDLTPHQGFSPNPVDWDLASPWPRLATKILRGHDDLLSVFRRKFAPVDSGMMKKEIKDCCIFLVASWQGTGRIRLKWMLTNFTFELIWGLVILVKKHGRIAERNYPLKSFSTICFFVHLIESIASNASCRRLVGLFHSKSQWVLIGLMVRPPRSKRKKVPSLQRFHHRKLTWHNQWALQVTLGKFWTGRFEKLEVGINSKIQSFAEIGMSSDKWPPKVMDFRPLHVWIYPNALTCILYLDICMIILGSTRVHMQTYEEWMNKPI